MNDLKWPIISRVHNKRSVSYRLVYVFTQAHHRSKLLHLFTSIISICKFQIDLQKINGLDYLLIHNDATVTIYSQEYS